MTTTSAFPHVPYYGLETLWFQSGGTLCNLRCKHCFISCSPENHDQELMTRGEVRARLVEARTLNTVREIYHTGGEPFINRELLGILADSLGLAETTVLTNGTLIDADMAADLANLASASGKPLHLRVSLDGADPATNDAIRGDGVWERAMRGMRHLSAVGFVPIVTIMRSWGAKSGDGAEIAALKARLAHEGIADVSVKILPALLMGAEEQRTRGYRPEERLGAGCVAGGYDFRLLQCSTSRMATAKGVYVCPILVADDSARMGGTLAEASTSYPLRHGACYTCRVSGLSCSN